MSDRIIFHCDCNSFFASVEEVLQPELKKVPMAVAGNPENRHGIILAKNILAKRYDIKTAETIYSARQKCPEIVCVPPHHKLYEEYCERINGIYLDYTDLVEPASIDESYLDVTNTIHLFGCSPRALADRIRDRVREETGVTISVGASFCKTFAKFGSDYKKPDATTVINRDNYKRIMYSLPVSELFMVGKKTAEKLVSFGIKTIGQLAEADREVIVKYFGKNGGALWDSANGIENEPVHSYYEKRESKSIGNSTTFSKDLLGFDEIRDGISQLSDSVARRLRAESKKCTVVQVGIKDPSFNNLQRQKTLFNPTDLQRDITEAAMELIKQNWTAYKPVRLLSVTASGLVPSDEAYTQLNFTEKSNYSKERQECIENTMDTLREKFGDDIIKFGY